MHICNGFCILFVNVNSVHQKRLKNIFVIHWVIFFLSGCISIYIYIFQCIFGRIGSSLLCMGFLCCGGWASSCRVFSYCRTRAPWCAELMGPWAQSLWHTALASLWHVGSSRTRYLTHVSCIARRILNHWATREAQVYVSFMCTMYVLP